MVQIEALNIPECQEGVTSPDGLLEGKHDRVKSETAVSTLGGYGSSLVQIEVPSTSECQEGVPSPVSSYGWQP